MEAARFWWLAPLLLSACVLTGAGAKGLCRSKRKTKCGSGLALIGGTCVETTWKDTVCVKDVKELIAEKWFYPKGKDICNLDECFCYCNKENYFFTIFFPAAKSSSRRRNKDGILVPGKSNRCWCHNHAGEVFRSTRYPLEKAGESTKYAIIVFNGASKSARAKTYQEHYNCARFAAPSSRSSAVRATGFPPGLGPTKSLTEQCFEKQKCYGSGTPMSRPKPGAAKNQAACFCSCFKQGFFFAGFRKANNRNICKCFNRKIRRGAQRCRDNSNQLKVQRRTTARKNTCCKAKDEKPKKKTPPPKKTAPTAGSRSSPVSGKPPPLPGSRSSPVAGSPPPLPGSRSAPVSGKPPPLPGSRSQPVSGQPPPIETTKPSEPKEPKTPTKSIAEEPDFEVPVDILLPDDSLPPFDPDFFLEYPPDPLPDTYLIELLPPENPEWPPANPPDQEPDIFIIFLPTIEYPPEEPPNAPLDVPFFVDPIYEYILPPVLSEYPDPIHWLPDEFSLPDPLDWIWPLDPEWNTYWPDLAGFDPSTMPEPTVIFPFF